MATLYRKIIKFLCTNVFDDVIVWHGWEKILFLTWCFLIIQKIWQLCRTESGILTLLRTKANLHTLWSYVILTFPNQCIKHVMGEQIIWILKSSILSNCKKLKWINFSVEVKKSMAAGWSVPQKELDGFWKNDQRMNKGLKKTP